MLAGQIFFFSVFTGFIVSSQVPFEKKKTLGLSEGERTRIVSAWFIVFVCQQTNVNVHGKERLLLSLMSLRHVLKRLQYLFCLFVCLFTCLSLSSVPGTSIIRRGGKGAVSVVHFQRDLLLCTVREKRE